ncbi:uncharacterized protein ARMOST_07623 [Armillaria ostoyae]|uniref:Uncharacterized protein n=1 Tax=Armillaria ostoyae TaxID=47428 RepID=A0A284R6F0_ARMOS|nr:uncharacterized protein ARMOST_07623 [Armillaria ostoyae]
MFDFVTGVYADEGVEMATEVCCEPEVFIQGTWKYLTDGRGKGNASLPTFIRTLCDFDAVVSP